MLNFVGVSFFVPLILPHAPCKDISPPCHRIPESHSSSCLVCWLMERRQRGKERRQTKTQTGETRRDETIQDETRRDETRRLKVKRMEKWREKNGSGLFRKKKRKKKVYECQRNQCGPVSNKAAQPSPFGTYRMTLRRWVFGLEREQLRGLSRSSSFWFAHL